MADKFDEANLYTLVDEEGVEIAYMAKAQRKKMRVDAGNIALIRLSVKI